MRLRLDHGTSLPVTANPSFSLKNLTHIFCDVTGKVENGIDNTQYRILHVRSKQDRARRTSSNEEEDDGGCIECGKNDKKHLQLQCSGCLVVFCHMKCAGLAAIPEDDWFCSGKNDSSRSFCALREHADSSRFV